MDTAEAIVEIKNLVDVKFINTIVPLINKKAKIKLKIGDEGSGGEVDTKVRNVKGYSLDFSTPTNLFYWNFIKNEISRCYGLYKAKFPLMASQKINQIDLLKYSTGGKYEVHTDQYSSATRHLSVIINLNDDYEGGDLVFTDQQKNEVKRFKLEKGSIIFFPSNFLYPHTIEPITKGIRYSIVAWLQ